MDRNTRIKAAELAPELRAHSFEEVCNGFTPEQAAAEASRCLTCPKPRCIQACPVGINIPSFIAEIKKGNIDGAAAIIAQDSVFPAICGRVCPQENQCEGACVMGVKGESIAIGMLERFVADNANSAKVSIPAPSGHKVAVIGSGPAGLACAADLARLGHEVTVFEALHKAGGVLAYGIPEFRLPKDSVLERELRALRELGVKLETDVLVGRTVTVDSLLDKEGFEAIFIGTGAGLPKFMGIKGENLCGVFSANELLTRSNLMHAWKAGAATPVHVGRKVCVVGGGNVAMDAARTALRLGAEVSIVYRRTEAELPARREEVRHAREEGIVFKMLTCPVEIIPDENGWARALRCTRMELGPADESGRRSPIPVDGSEFDIECDTVVMALGTSPNPLVASTTDGLETSRRGCIVADPAGATARPGIFAGGDAVSGAATVILAMGAGRRAARAIHGYLSSKV